MTTTQMIKVNTLELQLGDIVHTHGMRVLLDIEPREWTETNKHHPARGKQVRAYRGRVINLDDVIAEGFIPASWLYERTQHGIVPDEPRNDCWTIQGNAFASWYVERKADA